MLQHRLPIASRPVLRIAGCLSVETYLLADAVHPVCALRRKCKHGIAAKLLGTAQLSLRTQHGVALVRRRTSAARWHVLEVDKTGMSCLGFRNLQLPTARLRRTLHQAAGCDLISDGVD